MRSNSLSLVLAAVAAFSLVACSGGSKNSSSTTTSTTTSQGSPAAGASPAASPAAAGASPAASPAATTSGHKMALTGNPAPIPATLHCEGGQPPVWTNPKRHVYHTASDPVYGRTKQGSYMCLRDAVNAGYHASGMRHHAMTTSGGSMGGAATAPPSPAATM